MAVAFAASPEPNPRPAPADTADKSTPDPAHDEILDPLVDRRDSDAAKEKRVAPPVPAPPTLPPSRRPKDLRNPFLLARHAPPPRSSTDGGQTDRDLRHPWSIRGRPTEPKANPTDLRDPFEKRAPLPPVDLRPDPRCGHDDLPGGVRLQRPKSLEHELCGTASVDEGATPHGTLVVLGPRRSGGLRGGSADHGSG